MKPSQILQRTRVTLALLALGVTAADLAAREWTSADGKFKIEAELVEVKDGEAFLKRPDGSFVAVRIEKLSDRDRKFIESNTKSTARPANDSPSESEAVAPPGPIQIVKLAGEKPDDPPGEARRFSDLGWDVTSLAFSPTGGLLAAGKLDQTLILFDVNDSQRKATLVGLKLLDQITACAFTPEGGRLLAGGSSGLIGIWRLAGSDDLSAEPHFSGHVKKVTSIAVSSDGMFALSGGDDKLVRYWRIENGAELAMFEGFESSLKACHMSPDGGTGFATDGHALLTINLKSKKDVRQEAYGFVGLRPVCRLFCRRAICGGGRPLQRSAQGDEIGQGVAYSAR